ncbi:hypothetical protein SEA_FLAGSTAFF_60 [Mycobacterium phage FlagStaff]|uniref:Uncharacterized protein n=1 Tax=Mycobacterium phage FlagStaff TaxID=1647304 RepID=A0A0F6SJM9_9CAUD|nr:hypothetical protein AVT49_gp60 [Mycobacterium phage FlagStaff]AKF14497.1 hypothetical protein SEA_FLAGSTAFF_60 [Mycobacterium phage FlagStaff]
MTSTASTYTPDQAQAHDAIVAEAYDELAAAGQKVQARQHDVHRAAGDRERVTRGRRRSAWTHTIREATEIARKIAAGNMPADVAEGKAVWWLNNAADRAGAAIQALAIAEEERDAIAQRVDALEEVRDQHGRWARFFLVQGGHIHASRSCHTLRPTTRLGWLPDLSGLDEAAAVAAHGPLLCSHCFPTAPVAWTIGPQAPADECPGSKTAHYDRATARMGYCSGNAGTCGDCGQRITLTPSNLLRTHKRA